MNFTESWSRKAFFKSLNPILSKFGQKGSLIESHSKERKKKEIEKKVTKSITTTTHFKVSYLSCMFSFSFCSTVVFTLSKPEATVVVGCFFPPFPLSPEKGSWSRLYWPKTAIQTVNQSVNPLSKGKKERDEGHWRK